MIDLTMSRPELRRVWREEQRRRLRARRQIVRATKRAFLDSL